MKHPPSQLPLSDTEMLTRILAHPGGAALVLKVLKGTNPGEEAEALSEMLAMIASYDSDTSSR